MSHISRIKTRMVQKTYLLQALKDLGYTVKENATLRAFGFARAHVDIKISPSASGFDIGFVQEKDGYEIVADWWGVKNVTRDSFTKQVAQRYAYVAARDQLEKQGFTLVEENVDKDRRMRLVLRRTA